MAHKDYYKILEVTSAATSVEIKKSYRRLALQYHPDKNFGNQLYEAKFKEIQEAYRTLSDLTKRQEYNKQRHFETATNHSRKPSSPPVTAQSIVNQTINFRKKIAVIDPYRMNKTALYQHIQHLLSKHHIYLLQQNNDLGLNKRMIEEILFCSRYLPYVYVEKICFQLTPLCGTDNSLYRHIYTFSKDIRIKSYWQKYKLIIALMIALIICFLIYVLSIESEYN